MLYCYLLCYYWCFFLFLLDSPHFYSTLGYIICMKRSYINVYYLVCYHTSYFLVFSD